MKLCSLPEEEGENHEEKVIAMCGAIGCEVKPEDISTIHRNGQKRPGKHRPVLVKFTSRKSKGALMQKRKMLKDKD